MGANYESVLRKKVRGGGVAYARNLAAAERAVEVGLFNVAKVLRAVGHSQRVVATRAARRLLMAPDPQAWLEANLHGQAELDAFARQTNDGPSDEEMAEEINRLNAVDTQAQGLLDRSLKSLKQHTDVSEDDVAQIIWGCYGCGWLVEDELPDACPICGALSIEFEWFGPFYSSTPEHLGTRTPQDILATLEAIPDEVRHLLDRGDDEALGRRPAEDEWSVKEIIGHIIEVEGLFNRRVAFILDTESEGDFSTEIPPWALHEGKGYQQLPAAELVERLAASRQHSLDLLGGLSAEQWTEEGGIQGRPISVLELAIWLTNHDVGHVAQLRRYMP